MAGSSPKWTAPNWAWRVTWPLAILGLADSAYLTYVHFTSVKNLICSTGGVIDCGAVTTSAQSEIFGHIPVALTGLIYYVVVTAVYSPWAWRDERLRWPRLALIVSGMGMVFYLLYAELVQIRHICEYCTGVHVITLALFILTLFATLLLPLPALDDQASLAKA